METPKRRSMPVRRLTFSENSSRTTLMRGRKVNTYSTRKPPASLRERRKRNRSSPYLNTSLDSATAQKPHMTQYTVGKSASFSSDLVMELHSLMNSHQFLEPVAEEVPDEENCLESPIPSVLVEALENVKL